MINEFFYDNEVKCEEIPQNYLMSRWAKKLKTADFFFGAALINTMGAGFSLPIVLIVYYLVLKLFKSLPEQRQFQLGLLGVMLLCVILALLITTIRHKRKVDAKYRNRHYFCISKNYAQYVDGLPLICKYGAKLTEYVNDEYYVLIVLEGATPEESAFLLFPKSALEEKPRKAVYFSKKWHWFDKQMSKEEAIMREETNLLCVSIKKKKEKAKRK